MSLIDRLAPRRPEPAEVSPPKADAEEPVYATKTLKKFLTSLTSRPSPILLDLGPVIGSNVSFFGEQLGCKILVENIFAELDQHVRQDRLGDLPATLQKRFHHDAASVDGIVCWDLFDYLDRASAQSLADQLTRILRPEGSLLAFFANAQPHDTRFTKYLIVDEVTLKYRTYPAARGRQAILLNREITRLFSTLRVSDSVLLQNNVREILFRKPV